MTMWLHRHPTSEYIKQLTLSLRGKAATGSTFVCVYFRSMQGLVKVVAWFRPHADVYKPAVVAEIHCTQHVSGALSTVPFVHGQIETQVGTQKQQALLDCTCLISLVVTCHSAQIHTEKGVSGSQM